MTNGGKLYNSNMPARPQIIVRGSGSGTITVGDITLSISSIPADGLVLDCELQDAYSQTNHDNCNPLVSAVLDYPILRRGFTAIGWSGGISAVTVIPRWWTL